MNGDPKVVAALAMALLALSPVVNAIMTKAAEQADVSWLKEEGQEDVPVNPRDARGRLRPGPQGDPGDLPQPSQVPPRTPPPQCRPRATGPEPVRIDTPSPLGGPVGTLQFTIERGDLAIAARIEGQDVTGSPRFLLLEDGEERWAHDEMHVNARVQQPEGGEGAYAFPAPGRTWELRYDLNGAVHRGFVLALVVQRCAEGGA